MKSGIRNVHKNWDTDIAYDPVARFNVLFFPRIIIFIIYTFVSFIYYFIIVIFNSIWEFHNIICKHPAPGKESWKIRMFLITQVTLFHFNEHLGYTWQHLILFYFYFKHVWEWIWIWEVVIQVKIHWSVFSCQLFPLFQWKYCFDYLLLDKYSSIFIANKESLSF